MNQDKHTMILMINSIIMILLTYMNVHKTCILCNYNRVI